MDSTDGIRGDMVEEAVRVAEEAERRDVALRLLGGVAIKVRARDGLNPAFEREYADLDWITPKGKSAQAQKFFESLGYTPQTRFNAIHGRERLLYFDEENDRQVDVLIGSFRMCHQIPLEGRLDRQSDTVPLAELLLTKLQIIELNEKDVRDAVALFAVYDVTDDDRGLNGACVAELCAGDWGLWRTITRNLESVGAHLESYDVDRDIVSTRLAALQERIEAAPKSRGWRLREKVGERKRWYELPEEVGGA